MKILIISHLYPPFNGVGAKRMYSLSMYFAKKNYNIDVVKASDKEYKNSIAKANIHKNINVYSHRICFNNEIINRLFRNINNRILINKLLKNEYKYIFISVGPFSNLNLVPYLKNKFSKAKIIVDLRDVLEPKQATNTGNLKKTIGYLIDSCYEKKAIKKADLCLTVSDEMNLYYKEKYQFFKNKFICIKNGFDDITISEKTKETIYKAKNQNRTRIGNSIRIGIFGKFSYYNSYFSKILIESIKEIESKNLKIDIYQYGAEEHDLKRMFINNRMVKSYHYIESKGYEKDLLDLMNCDILLCSNHLKEAIGTKVFDYIFLNKPIIAIVSNKNIALSKLLQNIENSFVVTNSEEMISAILDIVNNNIYCLNNDSNSVYLYGRENQFNYLVKVLNEYENK